MVTQATEDDWQTLYEDWKERFMLFARQQTPSLADAEDVIQEAIVHLWSHRDRYAVIRPGLVFTQIRRFAIDRARSRKRRTRREQDYSLTDDPWFEPDASSGRWEDLESVLRKLPPEQQEVLVLKVWGEQTFESIGRSLDISPNTAASRYRYGLENMRKELNLQPKS